MPDDVTKTPVKPTDDALNAAADAVVPQPVPVPVPKPSETPPVAVQPDPVPAITPAPVVDPELHPTHLGRKVKKMEEDFSGLNSKLDLLLNKFGVTPTPEPDISDDDIIATTDDVVKLMKSKKGREIYRTLKEEELQAENEDRSKYQATYVDTFDGFKADNPDIHKEIVDEMLQHFNVVKTGNPSIDAELNYMRAKASVLIKRGAVKPTPKPNVKDEGGQVSTSIDVTTTADQDRPADLNLDDYAKEYIQKTGMATESARRALGGDAPIHLVNKR